MVGSNIRDTMGNMETPNIVNQSLHKKLFFNTSAQIIARAISALTTFIMTILIARRFGANGFGDFVKITTYAAFFYLLTDFGFNAIYLQRSPPHASKNGTVSDRSWEDLLTLRIVVSCVLVLLASAILYIIPQGTSQGYTDFVRLGILLFAPSIIFQALITTANGLFQKYLRYDYATIAVAVGSFVSLVLVGLVTFNIISSQNIISTTTALLVGAAVTAAVSLYLTRRLEQMTHPQISLTRMWSLFASSIPLGLTLLFNLVYFRVDSIILTLTRSTSEVGIYGLSYKAFELTLVLPTFFMNALYPVLLGSDNKKFKSLIRQSSVLLFVGSFVVMGCLWLAAPIISLVRSDFIPGIPALRVLSYGLPFFFLSSLTMWILIARKKQTFLAGIYALSMVLNIVLDVVFIPTRGYMAAAWITVVSEAVVLFMSGGAALKELSKKE